MRIFFNILLLAATAIVAVSCSTDGQDMQSGVTEPQRISFGLSVPSRAMVDSEEDLRTADISLYGKMVRPENGTTQIFNRERLYWDNIFGWRYDNLQFWFKGAMYHFLAVYPRSDRMYQYNVDDGSLSLNNYSAGYSARTEDLMYAVASRDLTNIDENSYTKVPLPFQHAKTRVEFYIKNASGQTIENIVNVSLTGLYYMADLNISAGGTMTWTIDETLKVNDANIYGGVCTMPDGGIPSNIDLEPHSLFDVGALTVLPQRVSKSGIMLNFDILFEGKSIVSEFHLDLGTIAGASTPEWEAGKRYVYTLTLTESTIASDINIADWIEDRIELL